MVPKMPRPQRSTVVLVGRFRTSVSSASNHDRNSVPDTCTRSSWCQACSCEWAYETELKCAQRMVPKMPRAQRSMVVLVGRFRFSGSSACSHDRKSVPDACTRLPFCQACPCKWAYQTEQKCAQRMVPKMPRSQRSMVFLV